IRMAGPAILLSYLLAGSVVYTIMRMIAATTAAFCLGTAAGRSDAMYHLVGTPGGFMPAGVSSVLAGTVSVFFSMTGAELTTIAAMEARDASSNQAKVASLLVGRVIVFYVCSVLLIVCTTPWRTVVPGTSPFATTLTALGVGWASSGMTVI